MKVYILCDRIKDRIGFHELLQKTLDLPEYYGKNLDALFDCLTDLKTPIHLVLCDFYQLNVTLGDYAAHFLEVCERASRENTQFTFEFARKDCLFL